MKKLSRRDIFTLILFVLMSFFLMCDLFITPAIVSDLVNEYNVEDQYIGYIGSAFVLVGAFISLFFGYLTDSISRKKLLVLTVLVGEIPCLFTGLEYFTTTVTGFFVMRVLTGIGVGGVVPITFSLVSDYFSDKHRAKAVAFVELAWGLGTLGGPALASVALMTDYGWRLAYILAAAPNFPIALIFLLYAKEPQRGIRENSLSDILSDDVVYSYKIKISDFKILFKNRSNFLLFAQGVFGCVPWGILTFWTIEALKDIRHDSHNEATMIWELFGIATAVGTVIWGFIGDRVYKRNPRNLPLMLGIGIIAGTIPCYILFNFSFLPYSVILFFIIIGGVMVSVAGPNVKAILMNINRPEHRGSVFSIFNLADSIGKGVGPALGGFILGLTNSYLFTMNFAISFWIICGLIMIFVRYTINNDINNLTKLMNDRADDLTKIHKI